MPLDAALAGFSPYARWLLDRACGYAQWLHAEEVGVEHLLGTLMQEEDCGAHRAVLHAFADPETIAEEARALSAGIMVTGSSASLPFSVRGVRALERARDLARARGSPEVVLAHLLIGAKAELEEGLALAFDAAGWNEAGLEERLGRGSAQSAALSGSMFRSFSEEARRVLSAAARAARGERTRAIAPAHVLGACLQADPSLEQACGLSASRARILLRGRTEDPTVPEARPLPADEVLADFLRGLPEGCGSAGMLLAMHAPRTAEVAKLLARHKVTPALLAPLLERFPDPALPGAPSEA